jgi:hypothetical protein
VLQAAGDWLRDLELTAMTKCYKMVTLEALLEGGALLGGMAVAELSARSLTILRRSPELARDLEGVRELSDLETAGPRRFETYWRTNPIQAWAAGSGRRWFALEGDRLVPRIPCPPGSEDALIAMTRELVDYRLAQYRERHPSENAAGSFRAKVISNKHDPILVLPPRATNPQVPEGDVDTILPDGSRLRFRFVKVACNVAHRAGSPRNELPDLLRTWFGVAAGKPGTAFHVRFWRSPDGLSVEPERNEAQSVTPAPRGMLLAFPTLRAAAGAVRAPEGECLWPRRPWTLSRQRSGERRRT